MATTTRPDFAAVQATADAIKARVGGFTPAIGIICGSGLGGLADNIVNPQFVEYKDIEGFPVSTGAVPGRAALPRSGPA
jgi:purine-nucleoside phosphorylase